MQPLNSTGTHDSPKPTKVDLSGVPETMLWPLWNRGMEARRSDRVLDDPMSVDLLDRPCLPEEGVLDGGVGIDRFLYAAIVRTS